MIGKTLRAGGALLLLLWLPGCAVQQWHSTGIGRYLERHSLDEALTELDAHPPERRDRAMYLLNRGMLQHLRGDYAASNRDLEAAKAVLERVQALSLSEGLTASTINDTLGDYAGTPSERVLLHLMMALNYLALHDLDGARVEALQADLRMRELPEAGAQLASARFIAGLVFELNGEWSDALIGYRKAAQRLAEQHQPVPQPLQRRLLNATRRLGLEDEYQQYLTRFGAQAEPPPGSGELLVLYLNGKVPSLQQRMISVFVPSLNHAVTIAQLYYPPRRVPAPGARLPIGPHAVPLERLEDLDRLARNALDAGQARRTALTLARVTAKHALVKNTRQKDPLLGMLADLAAILTEAADTRSWNLLPASIQIGSVSLAPGHYALPVDAAAKVAPEPLQVNIRAGTTQLLIGNSYRIAAHAAP